MKDRDGNEWVLVPCEATEEMLIAGLNDCDPIGSLIDWDDSKGECITRKTVADVYKAAIAAAPQFVAGEVTKEMCWNVFEDCDGCEKNMAETARHWLDRWRKELGPALGLVTREEMARSVEIRDTEIARLETDLELARRDGERYRHVRMMNQREFSAMWTRTMVTCAQFDELIDKARAGNGGGV